MSVTRRRRMKPPEEAFDADLLLMLEPHWFRIESRHSASVDEYGDITSRYSDLLEQKFTIVKHTPKGAWLEVGFTGGPAKFVLRDMQHRARAFAAPTQQQAREDFRLRKLYRISKLQAQILRAQREIGLLGDLTHDPFSLA